MLWQLGSQNSLPRTCKKITEVLNRSQNLSSNSFVLRSLKHEVSYMSLFHIQQMHHCLVHMYVKSLCVLNMSNNMDLPFTSHNRKQSITYYLENLQKFVHVKSMLMYNSIFLLGYAESLLIKEQASKTCIISMMGCGRYRNLSFIMVPHNILWSLLQPLHCTIVYGFYASGSKILQHYSEVHNTFHLVLLY